MQLTYLPKNLTSYVNAPLDTITKQKTKFRRNKIYLGDMSQSTAKDTTLFNYKFKYHKIKLPQIGFRIGMGQKNSIQAITFSVSVDSFIGRESEVPVSASVSSDFVLSPQGLHNLWMAIPTNTTTSSIHAVTISLNKTGFLSANPNCPVGFSSG